MKLLEEIGKVLEKNRKKLVTKCTFDSYSIILKKILKRYDVTEVTVCGVFDHNGFSFGGEYDMETNKISISLLVNSRGNVFNLEESSWKHFKFLLSQTLMHELIHQYQHVMRRDESTWVKHYWIERVGPMHKLGERVYLSDMDEVDAYAHDLAMEIKYYYPKHTLSKVFKNINYKKSLSTYRMYSKAFRKTDWFNIRKILLKKTYKWLV